METRLKNYLETWVPRIDEEMYQFLPKDKDPVDFLYAPMRDYSPTRRQAIQIGTRATGH